MNHTNDIQTIKDSIRQHFPLHPVPRNVGISAMSDRIDRFFNERQWCDVTAASILGEAQMMSDDCLNWMTEEGVIYYLPAYLLMAADEHTAETTWMIERFFRRLVPYEDLSSTPAVLDRKRVAFFEKFTLEQKRDIAALLLHQSRHLGHTQMAMEAPFAALYLAKLAYESYWSQFL